MILAVYTIPALAIVVGLVDLLLFSILRFTAWFVPSLGQRSVGEDLAGGLIVAGVVWYYLAIWVYHRLVRYGHHRRLRTAVRMASASAAASTPRTSDFPFQRIGLIFSGGGAKGAYQAGAMKAIHEFLQKQTALQNVVAVAGTSIGSWNTTFWLAEEVGPHSGGASLHESWWKSIDLKRIVTPAANVPVLDNHFMRNTPWQYTFDELFSHHSRLQACLSPNSPVHFYLTRTNVESGRLAFDTNNPKVEEAKQKEHSITHVHEATVITEVRQYKEAVFASMDIPPLFPYMKLRRDSTLGYYEDGGVADNLPIRLGMAFDQCDLLFVLPLNATFAQQASERSVVSRLMRVTTVRQGVLERNSLKLIYLFNELSTVRNTEPVLACILAPGLPLKIDTMELWKREAAADAFDLMYEATRAYLQEFFNDDLLQKVRAEPEARRQFLCAREVEMAVVPPDWQPGQAFEIVKEF
jgi:predicted acylesterase/phospholipase RssA